MFYISQEYYFTMSIAITGIVFTAQPTDMEACGVNETALFPCRYEGSASKPQWVINSTTYGSSNSELPPDHFYYNRILSVRNINPWQNKSRYQCQVLSLTNGHLLCAYCNTIGLLIVKCKGEQG